jgi:predicted translin family RNA/ssDNA-binding protein
LSKERLDGIVEAMKSFMSSETIRLLSHREIQCKPWHYVPEVGSYMGDLRRLEETVKSDIMRVISQLVYQCNVYSLAMDR